MKRRFEVRSLWLIGAFFLIAQLLLVKPALAQFPGAVFVKTPLGPRGTADADVGEKVITSITILNVDAFGDSFRITNLFDVVHHFGSNEISPDLLRSVLGVTEIVLPSFTRDPVNFALTV